MGEYVLSLCFSWSQTKETPQSRDIWVPEMGIPDEKPRSFVPSCPLAEFPGVFWPKDWTLSWSSTRLQGPSPWTRRVWHLVIEGSFWWKGNGDENSWIRNMILPLHDLKWPILFECGCLLRGEMQRALVMKYLEIHLSLAIFLHIEIFNFNLPLYMHLEVSLAEDNKRKKSCSNIFFDGKRRRTFAFDCSLFFPFGSIVKGTNLGGFLGFWVIGGKLKWESKKKGKKPANCAHHVVITLAKHKKNTWIFPDAFCIWFHFFRAKNHHPLSYLNNVRSAHCCL